MSGNIPFDPERLTEKPSSRQALRSYVLRARRMTEAQKRAIQDLGPLYALPFSDTAVDGSAIFQDSKPLILDRKSVV